MSFEKERSGDLEEFRPPSIVAVQIGEKHPSRCRHPDIASGGYTLAASAENTNARLRKARKQRRRSIRTAIVNDQQFPVIVGLRADALDRGRQECGPIARRQDDRDQRPVTQQGSVASARPYSRDKVARRRLVETLALCVAVVRRLDLSRRGEPIIGVSLAVGPASFARTMPQEVKQRIDSGGRDVGICIQVPSNVEQRPW